MGTAALNRRAIPRRGHRILSQSSPEPVRRNTKMSCREGLELIKPLPLREQRQCYERRGAIETNQERLLERSVYLVLMPGLAFFRPFLISARAGWIPRPLCSAFCVPHPTDYPSPPQPTQATWVGKGTNKSSFLHVNVPVNYLDSLSRHPACSLRTVRVCLCEAAVASRLHLHLVVLCKMRPLFLLLRSWPMPFPGRSYCRST